MTTRLTFPASMFSVVCQRCGSTVRKNADSCPNCGADRSAAFGTQREGTQRESSAAQPHGRMFEQPASAPMESAAATSGMSTSAASMGAGTNAADGAEPSLRSGWPGWDARSASERIAQKAAEYRARRVEESARNAYGDTGYDPDAVPGSERWNRKKTLIAAACGVVLLAGAVFFIQQGGSSGEDDDMAAAEHSVSGAIDAKIGPLARGAIDSTNVTGTPAAPPLAEQRSPADTRTLASGDALHSVRVALDQHDLGTARTRMKALPAQQRTRAEYETLKDELIKREMQRDAALQLARACERTSAWACVQQNAGEALALDGSNTESQAMLERVISHADWLAPSASAALAKKLPSSPPAPATATANVAPPPTNSAVAPAPVPPQANVAVPAKPNVFAQKPSSDRRAAQRSAAAAAHDAADETAYESRAEKIARGQAATNAITSTTVAPPAPPSIATMMTAAPPATTTQPVPPPKPPQTTAQAPAQRVAPPQPQPQPPAQAQAAARKPYYLGEEEPQPSAPAQARGANTRAPYYLGEDPPQSAAPAPAPAPQTGGAHAPYYLGQDPPQPVAPAPRPVPRPPQAGSQSGSLPPSAAPTMQAAVPRPPVSAQPVATTTTAPRVPPLIGQPATQSAATRSAQPAAGTGTPPQFATTPGSAPLDSDKSEDLERAIKQYGWSSGDSTSKPSR